MRPLMVIKGKSRSGASQLAAYLQRIGKNERIEILEHHSPHATLGGSFRDWEILAGGTQGEKSLYHAQINPDARYAMTPEQWQRAADVLEAELGLKDHPRAIVLHERDGREHIHVVWQRCDVDTMTLASDSWNYLAHEKASLALEEEFGHEHVPGKHAKRDRDRQPEFPRQETTQAEQQQAERTGIDPAERKAQIIALKAASDSAQAFKTALEEAGYILARGDRGYTLVDEEGDHFNLARQLKEKTARVNAFMADVPLNTLPALADAKEQAKALTDSQPHTPTPQQQQPQAPEPKPDFFTDDMAEMKQALAATLEQEARQLRERHKAEITEVLQTSQQDITKGLEARRALQDETLAAFFTKAEEFSDDWIRKYIAVRQQRWNWDVADQRRLERQQELDEIRARHRIERKTMIDTLKLERDQHIDDLKARAQQQPAPAEPSYKLSSAEIEPLRKAIDDRHAPEVQKLKDFHAAEMTQLRRVLDREIREKLANTDALQEAERNRLQRELYPERVGLDKFIETLKGRINPAGKAEDLAARDRKWNALIDRQEQQRTDRLSQLSQSKEQDITDLKERHAQKMREEKAKSDAELAKYIRQEENARKLLAEIQEDERAKELKHQKDGHGPPTHKQ